MNLVEFWRGTPHELRAQQIVHELKTGERLSAAKRRRLANAEAISRGPFIRRVASGITGLGSIALVGLCGIFVDSETLDSQSYSRLLKEEIARLAIEHNPAEKALWENTGITPYSEDDLRDRRIPYETLVREINPRIDKVVNELMPKSSNPYFVEASRTIRTLGDSGDLEIRPSIGSLAQGRDEYMMMVNHTLRNGRIVWLISPTAQMILARDPLNMAFQFTHQAEHVKDFIEEYKLLPESLSVEEKNRILGGEISRKWGQKEARAYGVEYLADIYQSGLLNTGPIFYDTRALLECRSDIRSQCWHDYINKA